MISQNRQISRYRNLHGWPKEFIDGLQTGMDGSWRVRGANKPTDGDEHHLLGGNLEMQRINATLKLQRVPHIVSAIERYIILVFNAVHTLVGVLRYE